MTNKRTETVIGVDPGFGNFKLALPTGELSVLPSVVGVGSTERGLLSLGKLGTRRRAHQPIEVTYEGITYLVGENVARYARPVQRMDLLRLAESPEVRALFYATGHQLLGAGDHALSMMVGLPVPVMANKELGRSTLRTLRGWLAGEHHFEADGDEVLLKIEDVRAMAQPAGAFFAWGMDEKGKWVRDSDDLQAPVAVCDIGFNTLDLFAVEGGDVVARFTGGDTVGMRRAAEIIAQGLKARHDVDISLHEADALLRERSPMLYTADGELDLGADVEQALNTVAAGVVQFVEQRWGNARQFAHVLFTGGGAEALKDALTDQYPHGVVLPEPVTANALGLSRYARRVFGKK